MGQEDTKRDQLLQIIRWKKSEFSLDALEKEWGLGKKWREGDEKSWDGIHARNMAGDGGLLEDMAGEKFPEIEHGCQIL